MDGFAPLIGGEALVCDGEVAGTVTSAGYGYTVGKTIAFGYVPADVPRTPTFEIVAFGKSYAAARAAAQRLRSATGARLKGEEAR